ncbi:hypothetical protein GGI21_001834 [Coemansia aciculifera]|nr:hypothetical protein GGI21_001834 [Coemansia aciculifera]
MYVSGTVAIVTGSAQGVGKRVAELLVARGGKVVLGDIKARGSDLADELNARYGSKVAVFYQCDIRSPNSMQALVSQAVGDFEYLDIVINAVNTHATDPWLDTNGDSTSRTIDVSLKAPIECTRVAVRHFLANRRKGCIVNVAAMAAFTPEEAVPVYSAAMYGLVGFTASCATLALNVPPVRVNAVAPSTTTASGGCTSADDVVAQVFRCIGDESLTGDTVKMPAGQPVTLHDGPKARPMVRSKL